MKSHVLLVGGIALALVAIVIGVTVSAPATTLNFVASIRSHRVQASVPYGPLARHRLDVYAPLTAASPSGHPVVVFFYGGAWNRGERADYRFVGEALAARGVLTLVADYRLYPEVRYPDFLSDSAQALAFGLSEAARLGGDPRRVFVMGHSAGAYNAAMLALDATRLAPTGHSPRELAGWIGLAGPYEFLPVTNPDAQPVFFHPNYPQGTQPINYVSKDAPRSFLAAPVEDSVVNPQRNTLGLAAVLRHAGVPVQVELYARVNHMSLIGAMAWPLHGLAPVLDDVLAFIDKAA